MNTYIVVLNNGERISIDADNFEQNNTRILFKVSNSRKILFFFTITTTMTVAVFTNNNIAGFYQKGYEAL